MRTVPKGKTDIHVVLPTDLLMQITAWRHEQHIDSPSEAIRVLLEHGMQVVKPVRIARPALKRL